MFQELSNSAIESYEAEEENSPLIQDKKLPQRAEDVETELPASNFSKTSEDKKSYLCTGQWCTCLVSKESAPDLDIKETLLQPQFYVLYLIILTLSLVS